MKKRCVNECVFVQGSNQEKTCGKVLQRNANIVFARKRFSFYAFTLEERLSVNTIGVQDGKIEISQTLSH